MQNNNPFLPNPAMNGGMNPPMPGGAPTTDSFEVDLTGVQDGSSYVIPDGSYKVKCTDVEQGVSKSGNPQFVWSFEVADGQYAGFQLKNFTAITPAAMWKIAETVQALGIGQTGSVVKFKRTDVINKECFAEINASEYNGKISSKIVSLSSTKEA